MALYYGCAAHVVSQLRNRAAFSKRPIRVRHSNSEEKTVYLCPCIPVFCKLLSLYRTPNLPRRLLMMVIRCPQCIFYRSELYCAYGYGARKTNKTHNRKFAPSAVVGRAQLRNCVHIKMLAHSENSRLTDTRARTHTKLTPQCRACAAHYPGSAYFCYELLLCTDDDVHQRRLGWPAVACVLF